jgi:hypothetical protein
MGDWAYLVLNQTGEIDEPFETQGALAAAKYLVPALWTSLFENRHFQDRTTEWDIYDGLLVPYEEGIEIARSRKTRFLKWFGKEYEEYFETWLEKLQAIVGNYLLLDVGEFNAMSGEGFGREIRCCVNAWENGKTEDVELSLGLAGFDFDPKTGKANVSPIKDKATIEMCLWGTFLEKKEKLWQHTI